MGRGTDIAEERWRSPLAPWLGDNLCLVFAMLLLLFSKIHKKLANKILEAQAGAVNIIITYTVAYVCACLCVSGRIIIMAAHSHT